AASWGLALRAASFGREFRVPVDIAQDLLTRLRVRPSLMRQHRRRPPETAGPPRRQDHPGRIRRRSEPLIFGISNFSAIAWLTGRVGSMINHPLAISGRPR